MTPSNPSDAAELRRRAEARLSEKQKSQRPQAGCGEDVARHAASRSGTADSPDRIGDAE